MKFLKKLFGSNTPDFKKLLGKGALVIDVRSPSEYLSGHIEGSINIPLNKIQDELAGIREKAQVVITVCRSGARSSSAQSILLSVGIEAYNGGPWEALKKKIGIRAV